MLHDFTNATDRTGDHRAAAGHRFQIDDSEWLVNRGTHENAGVTVELDFCFVIEHFVDPDHALAFLLRGSDGRAHFFGDFRGVGRTGTEDDLEGRIQMLDCIHEVNDPLLSCDATEEEGVGFCRVNAEAIENAMRGDGLVFLGVDAVVDDVHLGGIDIKKFRHILAGAFRNGDDGVSHFQCRFFQPAGKIISTPKLLALPRAERLERMYGHNERNAVVELREDSAEMGIPRVAMNDIGVDVPGIKI